MGPFSVYLLKEAFHATERYNLEGDRVVEDRYSFLDEGVTANDSQIVYRYIVARKEEYKKVTRASAPFEVFYRESDNENPWWKRFWRITDKLANKSTDVIAIVATPVATFVVTHGHARYLINPLAIEYDFGLRTALNLVDEDKLRAIDLFSPSEIGLYTRKQTGRNADAESYDIDIYNNLLKRIKGEVQEQYAQYFEHISGSDSIHFSFSGSPEELGQLLQDLHAKYLLEDYKIKGFEWVDNFVSVRDKLLIKELDELMLGRVNRADPRLLLTFPESLNTDVPIFYRFHGVRRYDRNHSYFPELDISEQYYPMVKDTTLAMSDLLDQSICACDVNTEKPLYKRKLYQCIYCELDHRGDHYFLESGTWYRVDQQFMTRVAAHIGRILERSRKIDFPYLAQSLASDAKKKNRHKELIFNRGLKDHLAAFGSAAVLDCEPIGKIEVCDVLFSDGDKVALFHNKYMYGSSALSHLFSQGYVSARNLLAREFRQKANAKIKEQNLLFPVDSDLDRKRYTVVYGIMAERSREGVSSLPLFSQINFEQYIRNLELIGFDVELVFFAVQRHA